MEVKHFDPFPVLHTARLILRQLESSDDREVFALRSNDEVNKYLGRKPAESIDDAKLFIQSIKRNVENGHSFYWAIALKESGKLIGTICLYNFSDDHLKAEIGFELLPEFHVKGMMQEAILTVIDFAFKQIGLHSIEAYSHLDNHSSTRLLEKIRFKKGTITEGNLVSFELESTS